MTKLITGIAGLMTIMAIVGGAVWELNEHHAKEAATRARFLSQEAALIETQRKTALVEAEGKLRTLEKDIDRDSKIRFHYDQLEKERPLSPAEKSRRDNIVLGLSEKYNDRIMVREDVNRLKAAKQ